MIPDLIDIGAPWQVLPSGVHEATFDEIRARFADTEWREKLYNGFLAGALSLSKAGCRSIYLDGSFVTEKKSPGDYDVYWDASGVDVRKLDPVFLDFSNRRAAQKKKFLGEYFYSQYLLDYFQKDKYTGSAKGIIHIFCDEAN